MVLDTSLEGRSKSKTLNNDCFDRNRRHDDCYLHRPLYDEVITLCLDLGELDATVAIVAELETAGIKVPDETLDKVLAAQQIEPVENVEESDDLS